MQFLEKLESFKMIEGVFEVCLLSVDDVIRGSDIFESAICLVGLV